MKSRQLCFYIDDVDLLEMMMEIQSNVLPRYEALEHFLGLTVIKADTGRRVEVLVTSFWDDGLETSAHEATRFINEIIEVTGMNPSRKSYDTLYAQVRDASGVFHPEPFRPITTD